LVEAFPVPLSCTVSRYLIERKLLAGSSPTTPERKARLIESDEQSLHCRL